MPSRPALELGGNEVMARRTSASVAMRVTVSSAGGWMSRKSDGDSGCLSVICSTTSLEGLAKESSDVRARSAPRTSPSASFEVTRRAISFPVAASAVRRDTARLGIVRVVVTSSSKVAMFCRISEASDFLLDLSLRDSGALRTA